MMPRNSLTDRIPRYSFGHDAPGITHPAPMGGPVLWATGCLPGTHTPKAPPAPTLQHPRVSVPARLMPRRVGAPAPSDAGHCITHRLD